MVNMKLKFLVQKFKKIFWFHKWKYQNPYNRRCVICGKHEQKYCYDWRERNIPGRGWWEVHDEGNENKHYK